MKDQSASDLDLSSTGRVVPPRERLTAAENRDLILGRRSPGLTWQDVVAPAKTVDRPARTGAFYQRTFREVTPITLHEPETLAPRADRRARLRHTGRFHGTFGSMSAKRTTFATTEQREAAAVQVRTGVLRRITRRMRRAG